MFRAHPVIGFYGVVVRDTGINVSIIEISRALGKFILKAIDQRRSCTSGVRDGSVDSITLARFEQVVVRKSFAERSGMRGNRGSFPTDYDTSWIVAARAYAPWSWVAPAPKSIDAKDRLVSSLVNREDFKTDGPVGRMVVIVHIVCRISYSPELAVAVHGVMGSSGNTVPA